MQNTVQNHWKITENRKEKFSHTHSSQSYKLILYNLKNEFIVLNFLDNALRINLFYKIAFRKKKLSLRNV